MFNQHLFIYSPGNSDKKLEYSFIESLRDNNHKTYPFNIQINNSALTIDLVKIVDASFQTYYNLKSFYFENYSSIKRDELKENSFLIYEGIFT